MSFAACEPPFARSDSIPPSSVLIIDNGRLRAPVNARDEGLCCQERVPARFGTVATLGELLVLSVGFDGCGSMFRGEPTLPVLCDSVGGLTL